jgi:hypothetical protein
MIVRCYGFFRRIIVALAFVNCFFRRWDGSGRGRAEKARVGPWREADGEARGEVRGSG